MALTVVGDGWRGDRSHCRNNELVREFEMLR
jgi:hypothetical protein